MPGCPMTSILSHKRRSNYVFAFPLACACTITLCFICVAFHQYCRYLHCAEVARTRMREEGNSQRYRRFWQTLSLVAREEGVRGVYGGLSTQLIKHIPNMAIMMSTYEAVVYICRRQGF